MVRPLGCRLTGRDGAFCVPVHLDYVGTRRARSYANSGHGADLGVGPPPVVSRGRALPRVAAQAGAEGTHDATLCDESHLGYRCPGFFLGAGAVVAVSPAGASGPVAGDPAGGTGSYLLTATTTGPGAPHAPTFTGNGELGVRVPPAGQGYAGGPVPTQSELAGFYAEPPGSVQQRANIPTWSTLTFADGGESFTPGTGSTSGGASPSTSAREWSRPPPGGPLPTGT